MHDYMIKENEKVGLHDCRTNQIHYDAQTMTFEFPEGYYIFKNNEPERTGKANMQCHILDEEIDGVSVFLYKELPSGKVIREDWSDTFLTAINNGTFEFEFVTTYRSYQHILFKGFIWFNTKPYHMECEIELHTDEIVYSWMKP